MAFSLKKDSVEFIFNSPLETLDDFYIWENAGEVPCPEIKKGDRILLPVDEGMVLKADGDYFHPDFDFQSFEFPFCRREATMNMIIIERDKKFLLIALSDGKNSSYKCQKINGLYSLSINNKKSVITYYKIFDNLISACKFYKSLKKAPATLLEKKNSLPEIEKLIGGAKFWIFDDNYDEVMYSKENTEVTAHVGDNLLKVAKELKEGGVDRALIGIFFEPDNKYSEPLYKDFSYISTQYDNYNDVLNEGILQFIPSNRIRNCDYTARRAKDYPDGIGVNENGEQKRAWGVFGFDGKEHFLYHLCAKVAKKRIAEEVPEIIKKYPYFKGRFLDCFGTGLEECFNPLHPLTREESADIKRDAFKILFDMGLITGTEDGMEEVLDYLVYSEGMHSPDLFRNANSGRRQAHIFNDYEKTNTEKYMLNPSLRVPLWQMVYHECLIPFSYWGDSTDACIEQIDKKILFACLFGCPPLYSFKVGNFEKLKEAILYSYKKITPIHSKIATLPMTDYEVLSEDYMLQTSVFGEKYRVVANFSNEDREYNGKTIGALDLLFEEI